MDGIILINKEIGKTSRDEINSLCHIFNTKKIGHTGTLDPIATGVLVVCLNKYTKLVNILTSLEKEYIAKIKLGIKTDTLDITGNVIEERKCSTTKEKIEEVLKEFIGIYKQTIPLYSAKKINGKKLYEYARNNESVKLPTNEVEIYDLKLISFENDEITIKCNVSKGTYIRSLIQSICDSLNVIGTMSSLIRTKQGKFDITNSYTIEEVKNGKFKLLKAKDILDYKIYNLNDLEYKKVKNGNHIFINSNEENLILTYNDKEIAIYKKSKDMYIPSVMLV
ncbi:MAG: tRNA pseudouridine(55) synthase TruB [Bacilli bacterium]